MRWLKIGDKEKTKKRVELDEIRAPTFGAMVLFMAMYETMKMTCACFSRTHEVLFSFFFFKKIDFDFSSSLLSFFFLFWPFLFFSFLFF